MNRILNTLLAGLSLFAFSCTKPEVPDNKEDETPIVVPDTESGLSFEPETLNADSPCTIWFKPSKDSKISSTLYNCKDELYAHIGLFSEDIEEWVFVQAEWNSNIEKCHFERVEDNLYKLEIKPTIREYFASGSTPVTKIAIVIRNAGGNRQTRPDQFVSVQDDVYKETPFTPGEVKSEAAPAGTVEGINYNKDNTVTLALYGKDKSGKRHDWAYVLCEASKWERNNKYMMKWDAEKGYWWYTFTDVDPSKEYLFQYRLGDAQRSIRIPDPYSEVFYDGNDDKYIPSTTYPDLTPYPDGAKDPVSAFRIERDPFDWAPFSISDENSIVIYELLLRDFSSTKDLNGAISHLDYLKDLGVGAVELMPVQEFDGNESWGYNPRGYFALDKAYGTPQMYKTFIDECHRKGMAVILDVVYNHATGAHPFAKLYWDAGANNVSAENPWFNVVTPHGFGVFHDWNHQEPMVREHIKRSLSYLLREYHVDGFRFDLTKGFTNNRGKDDSYDRQRVEVLNDYGSFIKSINPDAMVIFEHFVEAENKDLGEAGFHMWGNNNTSYASLIKGGSPNLDYSYDPDCYRVSYMESHDEERICANAGSNLPLKMRRAALAAAHFLTAPGPRMIWQFGELGYDISINYGGSNVSPKPVKWDYLDDPDRKGLFDTYSALLHFRSDNPEFFTKGAEFHNGYTRWGKAGDKSFILVGNYGNSAKDVSATLPSEGHWHSLRFPSETYDGDSVTLSLEPGEFRILTNF